MVRPGRGWILGIQNPAPAGGFPKFVTAGTPAPAASGSCIMAHGQCPAKLGSVFARAVKSESAATQFLSSVLLHIVVGILGRTVLLVLNLSCKHVKMRVRTTHAADSKKEFELTEAKMRRIYVDLKE
eukprot:140438-Hanusia_phi.AAC.1